MNSRKIRFLLWSGCLGGVVLFAGDMLYYGGWGPAQLSVIPKIMAHVASWRLHLGSLTGPVGGGLELLGMLGLWFCCRRAAPRLAAVMLAGFYVRSLFIVLQHGLFGPLGFTLQSCEENSGALAQMFRLNTILAKPMNAGFLVGALIWIFLVLKKRAGVPRWTIFLCPFFTSWLDHAIVYMPAPLGYPLLGGWNNIAWTVFFAVVALTYKERALDSRLGEAAESKAI